MQSVMRFLERRGHKPQAMARSAHVHALGRRAAAAYSCALVHWVAALVCGIQVAPGSGSVLLQHRSHGIASASGARCWCRRLAEECLRRLYALGGRAVQSKGQSWQAGCALSARCADALRTVLLDCVTMAAIDALS
jgi:hypothetical protein